MFGELHMNDPNMSSAIIRYITRSPLWPGLCSARPYTPDYVADHDLPRQFTFMPTVGEGGRGIVGGGGGLELEWGIN